MQLKQMTRTALILALMLIFQSLRLFFPVPPFVSVFVVGSLVNACLLIAVEMLGWGTALIPAVIAPLVAALQEVIPPVIILPIAAANVMYVLGYKALAGRSRPAAVALAAAAKFTAVYLTVTELLKFLPLPEKAADILIKMLGWPQIITGFAGGIICLAMYKKLRAYDGGTDHFEEGKYGKGDPHKR